MSGILEAQADRVTPTTYGRSRTAFICAAVMLLLCFARYLVVAVLAIRFPYGIDYGEGIVWQQMRLIMAGKGYASIDGFPAIAFPYPPLYYVASSLLASLTGMDQLAAGRLLSVCCAVATAALVGAIVAQFPRTPAERGSYRICGFLAGLMALNTLPVLDWSMLMRVDMLYVALSFAGLYFGLRALTRPKAIHIAALCFVAAIFTKQIAIAAPGAVFGSLLFLRPRTAWAGIATSLAAALAALALMMWLTGGGFLQHVVFYTITRFKLSLILDILATFGSHIVYCALAIWGIRTRLRRLQRGRSAEGGSGLGQYLQKNPGDAGFVMTLAYLLLATLLLVAELKRGSSINYYLEWICLIALFAGLALVDLVAAAMGKAGDHKSWLAAMVPWSIAFQAFGIFWVIGQDYSAKAADSAELAELVSLVRKAPQPVISDDMVAILRGGKAVQWEPFIFAELAKKGAWDERPLVARIKAHQFAFFVTEGYPGDNDTYDERYDPAVSEAIKAAYPVKRKLAGYDLHFPSGPLPAPMLSSARE